MYGESVDQSVVYTKKGDWGEFYVLKKALLSWSRFFELSVWDDGQGLISYYLDIEVAKIGGGTFISPKKYATIISF